MFISNLTILIAFLLSGVRSSLGAGGERGGRSATNALRRLGDEPSELSAPETPSVNRSQRRTSSSQGGPVRVCLNRALTQCDCKTMQESNCFRDVLVKCDYNHRQNREDFRNNVRRRYRRKCRGSNGGGGGGGSGSGNGGVQVPFSAASDPAGSSSLSSEAEACLKLVKNSCNCGLWMKGSDCPEQTAKDCNQASDSLWKDVRKVYKEYCRIP